MTTTRTLSGLSPFQNFLGHFSKRKSTPDGFLVSCPCPGHGKGEGDRNPSLSVSEGDDGRVLLQCFAGCNAGAIVQAVGLELADLFPPKERPEPTARHRRETGPAPPEKRADKRRGVNGNTEGTAGTGEPRNRATLEALADYCRLPKEHLEGIGWRDTPAGVEIPYRFTDGSPARMRLRYHLKGSEGSAWRKGETLPVTVYGAELVPGWSARKVSELHIVEGETDAAVFRYLEVPALGLPGAQQSGKVELEHVRHAEEIYLYQEPDHAGETLAADLSKRLEEIGWTGKLRIVPMAATGFKDIRDAWISNPDREAFLGKTWPEILRASRKTKKRAVTLAELQSLELPKREILLGPWIRQRWLGMVFAERGVGKSWLCHGVALAAAAGRTFLRWTAPQPRRVLLVDGELTSEELRDERLLPLCKSLGIDPRDNLGDNLRILAADLDAQGISPLQGPEGQAEIEEHLEGVDLLILDNVSALFGGLEENDATAWNVANEWLLSLKRKGVAVLMAHHAGRVSTRARGTSRREDSLDAVLCLTRPDDYEPEQGARFVATFTKSRGLKGREVESFEARQEDSGRWTTREAVDETVREVAELLSEGKSIRQVASKLHKSKGQVERLKTKAIAAGLVTTPDDGE